MQNDTIAAIATAPGEGGISIIRVSGNEALTIADKIFYCGGKRPSERPANSFVHGFITCYSSDNYDDISPLKLNGTRRDIDEAILLIYRAPHSYTREDVVEFQGHGGAISAKRILRAVIDAGARPAEPGEFTRRAFLSGRIDLLQAEAVMDLIKARSDRAAASAVEQLEGHLSGRFNAIYDRLLAIAGDLESTLDFDDDELPPAAFGELSVQTEDIINKFNELLKEWDQGHLLREGATVVLHGKPNAGKSTLLNALLGTDRAIVTHVAGTTRDILEEQLIIDGIPIRLIDTAGIRDTTCDIEQESIRRALHKVNSADVSIYVLDGSVCVEQNDMQEINKIHRDRTILVINKSDLELQVKPDDFKGIDCVVCGIGNQKGLEDLRRVIIKKLGVRSFLPNASISERHRLVIVKVLDEIKKVKTILESGNEEHIILAAGLLRTALEQLGTITGRQYHDSLLDHIFGNFCIGK